MTGIPEGYEDLLVRPLFGHLATVRPDGDPAVTPMWYSWDGEVLKFTHTTRRAKLRNIESNPHVAISIIDPDQPYRYLQARGKVEGIEPDPTGAFYVELAQRYGREKPDPAAGQPRPGDHQRAPVRVLEAVAHLRLWAGTLPRS